MNKLMYLMALLIYGLSAFAQAPKEMEAAEILLQMKKLNVLGSVLYIAAHPDDENNTLLPYLAKEKLYRTAYLSLTRGDGGQNLIGDEQGIELGLIRTQELLAARKIDGAEQYFSRAFEFGFSKSSEEALRIWDKEKILADVVWVIRQYQPDIIIKRFPPDARAGHGHHAASSIIADEAFIAAADPKRFPEQFNYGVKPWQAKRIMWNTYNFGSNNTTSEDQLKIEIGGFNPLLGKSYGEIGAEARTMHKSQGEGRPRRFGQLFEYFATTNGEPAKADLLDGVNTTWSRLDAGERISKMIGIIIDQYRPERPELSVTALVGLYRAIRELPAGTWRNKKLEDVQALVEACSGIYAEATSGEQNVTEGDSLKISFLINKRAGVNAVLKRITADQVDTSLAVMLNTNQNFNLTRSLLVTDKPVSQPYWLEYPLIGGTFDVRDQLRIGTAENRPAFEVKMQLNIEGEDFIIIRPVQYRFVDPVKGDTYQPIAVLPRLEMNYSSENYISVNGSPVKTRIDLRSNSADSTGYTIVQQYSDNWVNDDPAFLYRYKGEREFSYPGIFMPKAALTNSSEEIQVKAVNSKLNGYTKKIAYDHIPVITYFPKAKANLVRLDVIIKGKKIGYITGAGDKVPQALEQMGYQVILLNENDLTDENLKQFDAIITGIRAYNIHEYLTNRNDVLKRFVENGGNLVVQYLKSNLVGQKKIVAGPYPFTIDGGTRVTEEDAEVRFLLPQHDVLNYPNKITQKDFEGWVQERSTYQAVKSDEHFEMPLGMNDKGAPQSNGSLAIAKYGKGNMVYASLVFFRQLPAGVPGAYRLMANIIALPKNKP